MEAPGEGNDENIDASGITAELANHGEEISIDEQCRIGYDFAILHSSAAQVTEVTAVEQSAETSKFLELCQYSLDALEYRLFHGYASVTIPFTHNIRSVIGEAINFDSNMFFFVIKQWDGESEEVHERIHWYQIVCDGENTELWRRATGAWYMIDDRPSWRDILRNLGHLQSCRFLFNSPFDSDDNRHHAEPVDDEAARSGDEMIWLQAQAQTVQN